MIILDPEIHMRERQDRILEEIEQDRLARAAMAGRGWRARGADALLMLARWLDPTRATSLSQSVMPNKKVRQP
jgi:hypothetical protein